MAEVLSTLDAPLLAEHNCWFGGGTAIVLSSGEFRESVDIDFLVSDARSYRELRQMVRGHGLESLATRELEVGRTPAVDGYGIRTTVLVAGVAIKFEIIHEGRIDLDRPSPGNEICGIRTLTRTDQVASKLLANDDRWADTSAFSRDLIDLAMMKPDAVALKAGARKAVDAYGKTIGEPQQGHRLPSRQSTPSRRIHPSTQDRGAPSSCLAEHPRPVRPIREDRRAGSGLGLALGAALAFPLT
ncbi:hypothetical protein GCM10009668_27570 [Nocardioides dubius]|uniref:Nucleotidyl transferase AbiEii toxin, Type IV TA system n=1 Tax=Nocardioides dubius TaxID=317019 RepID=A0ABN1TXW0_9ACTN